MSDYAVIGKRLPRVDAVPMATGTAQYTGDVALAGMLHGKLLRSPYPHAKILNIDTSRAERLPGVKGIITGRDPNNKKWGFIDDPTQLDEYPLAFDKVLYVGDEIAAVAATDEDIALEAIDLIRVEYEELPAIFDIEEAMKPDTPQIHEGTANNIAFHLPINFGAIEDGFKESDHIREDKFIINPVHNCFLEPLVCIADFSQDNRLTIWTPTQTAYFLRRMLASVLGMREGDIRLIKPFMGGGHCSKHEALAHHFCAAMLSKKTGRPVKTELSRDEVFTIHRAALKAVIELKTGVKKDGTFIAKQCKLLADMGAYKGMGPVCLYLTGAFLDMPYRVPNLKYDGYFIYTNNAPMPGLQRGSGVTTIRAADDTQIDMIANDLGIDPAEIRLKNAIRTGDTTAMGFKIKSGGLSECIEKATELTNWRDRREKSSKYKGIGIACGSCSSGFKGFSGYDTSSAFIKVHEDGTVTLITGAMEIGQGINTVLAQIAAEELGVSLKDVKVISGDTDTTPIDLGSYGSRGTLQAGNAVKAAAADAKGELFAIAAEKLGAKIEDLVARNGRIYLKGNEERGVSIAEAAQIGLSSEGKPILGKGFFNPSSEPMDPTTLKGNVSLGWSFTAEVAEVEVNPETGKVTVTKFTAADDCGFALNPMAVEGQIEGEISQGLGQALLEERISSEGSMLNPSFLEYKVPTALDMPETQTICVQTNDPDGPFGAKECGEGPQVPVVPAITNAIAHATGIRIKEFPVSPEKLLELLKSL